MSDPYATRSTDDHGEILCTAEPALTASLGWHHDGATAPEHPPIAPSTCLASAMLDIGHTAAAALTREYSQHLPPALPPTV